MNRTLFILLAAVVAIACARTPPGETDGSGDPVLAAQEPAPGAVSAAPEHYRVLWEEPGVRALAATWLPGTRDAQHSHPTTIWYALTDFDARLRGGLQPGVLRRAIEAGDSGVQQPVLRHSVENAGEAAAELILFELAITTHEPTSSVGGPDAVAAANAFQLLEAHGGYRLIEARLGPRERLPAHSHPPALWFALTDAELRSTAQGLSDERLSLVRGQIVRREAVRAHALSNTGPRTARWLVFEIP